MFNLRSAKYRQKDVYFVPCWLCFVLNIWTDVHQCLFLACDLNQNSKPRDAMYLSKFSKSTLDRSMIRGCLKLAYLPTHALGDIQNQTETKIIYVWSGGKRHRPQRCR
jgi:hypothetical protein